MRTNDFVNMDENKDKKQLYDVLSSQGAAAQKEGINNTLNELSDMDNKKQLYDSLSKQGAAAQKEGMDSTLNELSSFKVAPAAQRPTQGNTTQSNTTQGNTTQSNTEEHIVKEKKGGTPLVKSVSEIPARLKEMGYTPPEDDAAKAARKKRERRNAILSTVFGGVRALGNLFNTFHDAPPAFDSKNTLTDKVAEGIEKDRERRRQNEAAWRAAYFRLGNLLNEQERYERTLKSKELQHAGDMAYNKWKFENAEAAKDRRAQEAEEGRNQRARASIEAANRRNSASIHAANSRAALNRSARAAQYNDDSVHYFKTRLPNQLVQGFAMPSSYWNDDTFISNWWNNFSSNVLNSKYSTSNFKKFIKDTQYELNHETDNYGQVIKRRKPLTAREKGDFLRNRIESAYRTYQVGDDVGSKMNEYTLGFGSVQRKRNINPVNQKL